MTTFLQFHLLTFVPPANMNHDDVGKPKTASVGGQLRLRLSSQSLKRAWRTSAVFRDRLAGHLGARTQRFGEDIRDHLEGKGVEPERAAAIAREVIVAFGKPKPATDKNPTYTEQLAFLSSEEQTAALALAEGLADGTTEKPEGKKLAHSLLRGADTAADIAMFGRMFADNADFNREAAVQVAHAFTTHRVVVEDDYYTAVDDLKESSEDAGAGFVGEAGFGSGVFYLYLCVDTDLLIKNLVGDEALAGQAVAALLEAAATVGPGGKQASFASRIRASYVMVEKGSEQPRTLASAFAKGVTGEDLMATSIDALIRTRHGFNDAYGLEGTEEKTMNILDGAGSLKELVTFATDWRVPADA